MKEEQLKKVVGYLAEELVPDNIDLWPAIRSQFEMSKKQSSNKGDLLMKTNLARNRRLSLVSIFLFAILILASLLLVTPQGRALAQEFLHLFSRASSDVLPAPTDVPITWVNQTPEVIQPTSTPFPGPAFAAACGTFPDLKCSVDQIRSMVNFPIKELGSVPDGVNLLGATGGPDQIYLIYDTPGHHGAIMLWQAPWTGSPDQTPWQVGASANVEAVTINGLSGEYVQGSFNYRDGQPTINWDASQDAQTMVWIENGILIEMQSSGTAMPLDRDKFVALGETLTTGPVAVKPTSLPIFTATPTLDALKMMNDIWHFISLGEAQEKAGFVLLLPAKLPDFLSFMGATYDSDLQVARLHYLFDQIRWGPNTDGLILDEERIPTSGNCALCGFVIQDKMALTAENKDGKIVHDFTEVQIGTGLGQYVSGGWESGNQDTSFWAWNPDPYSKRLRWEVDGMAFELSYWGNGITQADLITLAESIQ